jgi:gamma-glutamyltranspeptidase/glutathione hydrolase
MQEDEKPLQSRPGLAEPAAASAGSSNFQPTAQPPVTNPERIPHRGTMRPEIVGSFGIVAAGRHYAVAAGIRMLCAGGNATDAGVAAVFAAAVTEISHFGLGGEAPAIVFDAKVGKTIVISGQGTAPAAANPTCFASAGVIPGNGPKAGTLPAVVDAMALALQHFGTMTFAQVLAPAIEYADGFPMYALLRDIMIRERLANQQWAWTNDTYYPQGHIPEVSEIFSQPNLARTLRALVAAEQARGSDRTAGIEAGRNAFYKGDIARRIAEAVQADGGLITYDDMAGYRGRLEEPLTTRFMGFDIQKAGFWSQGPALLMTLNILEAAGIAKMTPASDIWLHTLAEAIKLAFDDRNAWFGDPLFAGVPEKGLLSKTYAAARAKQIGDRASVTHRYGDPYAFQPGPRPDRPGFVPHALTPPATPIGDTTAIEVVDRHGNLFSCTPSSGWLLGGAYIAGNTGVPLGNRMTVFDLDADSPNVLAPGKRPRTTLTPSVILKDGKPFLAIGTPGGDNQDQNLVSVMLNLMVAGMPLQEAIEAPRINSLHFHNSFATKEALPGVLEVEEAIPADIRDKLGVRGHILKPLGTFGIGAAVVAAGVNLETGTLRGGADVRFERYAFGW